MSDTDRHLVREIRHDYATRRPMAVLFCGGEPERLDGERHSLINTGVTCEACRAAMAAQLAAF